MVDKIDNKLLKICRGSPGLQLNQVVNSFLQTPGRGLPVIGAHALRTRLYVLENEGLLRLDRESVKRRVFCYITDAGEDYLEGRAEIANPKAGDHL
jgi:hypothetical protein